MTQFKKTLALCAVTVATLWSAGCTKQQVVKQDQMIPPAAVAAEPVKAPVQVKQEKKEPVVAAAAIDESQTKKAVEPAPVVAPESPLKNALEKVFFDFDSYTLSETARTSLAKNAELIRKDGAAKIRIEGHCDELGSDDYNLALGERRAKAAQKYLENMGVPADRLSTISYGKERPVDAGHDDAARAKNRRDEFVVSSK